MNKKNVISVKKLNKIYSKKSSNPIYAINNLNLDVQEGEIFGLLGPNGAGKTTFINILAGTVIKSSGDPLSTIKPSLIIITELHNLLTSSMLCDASKTDIFFSFL